MNWTAASAIATAGAAMVALFVSWVPVLTARVREKQVRVAIVGMLQATLSGTDARCDRVLKAIDEAMKRPLRTAPAQAALMGFPEALLLANLIPQIDKTAAPAAFGSLASKLGTLDQQAKALGEIDVHGPEADGSIEKVLNSMRSEISTLKGHIVNDLRALSVLPRDRWWHRFF